LVCNRVPLASREVVDFFSLIYIAEEQVAEIQAEISLEDILILIV